MRADAIAGAEPAPYTPGRDPDVDSALEVHACRLPAQPLWWDVVDSLFDAGAETAAIRAQRYAVPVLHDFLAAVRDPSVQGLVADTLYGAGGETVTQAFARMMTAASARWPIMFSPTAFDVGNAPASPPLTSGRSRRPARPKPISRPQPSTCWPVRR